jgi:molybdopterin biosynthesis enzyme
MEMCPFDKGQCGQNQAFEFNNVGESQKVSVSLDQGATCTYKIKANKGLPTFSPSVSDGFDISVVDYDDDDLPASRML